MQFVNIVDVKIADHLSSLGYKYTKRDIGNTAVYIFPEDNGILKELNSTFDTSSFFMSNIMNFERRS